MRVRIGKLVVEVDTPEELDMLVQRYGGETPLAPNAPELTHPGLFSVEDKGGSALPTETHTSPLYIGGVAYVSKYRTSAENDRKLINALVEGGHHGVHASVVRDLLGGVQGRAVSGAIRGWALRVGIEPSEVVIGPRIGNARHWRLTEHAIGTLTGQERPAHPYDGIERKSEAIEPAEPQKITNRDAIVSVLARGQAMGTADIHRAVLALRPGAVYATVAHEILRLRKEKVLIHRGRGARGMLYGLAGAEGGAHAATVN